MRLFQGKTLKTETVGDRVRDRQVSKGRICIGCVIRTCITIQHIVYIKLKLNNLLTHTVQDGLSHTQNGRPFF